MSFIDGGDPAYGSLLSYLFDCEFIWSHPLDENRYVDGINLRDDYSYYHCPEDERDIFISEVKGKPCSMLEMLIALTIRCGNFMANSEGVDYSFWFWNMLDHLELMDMHDRMFDRNSVDDICDRFISREYSPDGRGGLFWIPNCPYDLRKLEIWRQVNLYMIYISEGE